MMKQSQQTTLRAAVALTGVGVHSGDEVRIVLHPAEANHGIVFLRTGLASGRDRLIDAKHLTVTATELCTVIGDRESGAVATIEHLMAAFAGLGVDNVLVEIDGPEVPILDGSSAPFIAAIDEVGLALQGSSRRYLKVLKPVRVTNGKAFAEIDPERPRIPSRGRDRFSDPGHRSPEQGDRSVADDLPPGYLPRPHLRLHA